MKFLKDGKRPDWLLFYTDGTIFTSHDGMPYDAPPVGIIVMIQENANGNWVLYQRDLAYVWGWRSENEWVPVDLVGILDYIFHHRGIKSLVFGRWTSNKNFEKIWQEANKIWRELANGTECLCPKNSQICA